MVRSGAITSRTRSTIAHSEATFPIEPPSATTCRARTCLYHYRVVDSDTQMVPYLHGPEIARLLAAGARIWPNCGVEVPYDSAYDHRIEPDVFTSKLSLADLPGTIVLSHPLVDLWIN